MSQPLDPSVVAEIQRLAAEGVSAYRIAKDLGVSPWTVNKYAPRGSFDRSKTAIAVEAHKVDAAARRAAISEELLAVAARIVQRMASDHLSFGWYGKDGDYHEKLLDEPPPADMRQFAGALSSVMATHLRLVQHDSDGGRAAAESALDGFMNAVAARVAELEQDE